jgi:hypothetical protein
VLFALIAVLGFIIVYTLNFSKSYPERVTHAEPAARPQVAGGSSASCCKTGINALMSWPVRNATMVVP